jgi:hypothetical protein
VLGRGKDFEIVDAADWRTKAAQEARETAAAVGKIGILKHQFERAVTMSEAAAVQLKRHKDSDAFTNGDAEVMIAWEEDGIWFRALVDWLHKDLRTIDDLQDHRHVGRRSRHRASRRRPRLASAGGFHRARSRRLDPPGAGRRLFRFVGQEDYPPHALNVMHMSEYVADDGPQADRRRTEPMGPVGQGEPLARLRYGARRPGLPREPRTSMARA